MMFFIHSVLSSMFRPVLLPSSGRCFYKNIKAYKCRNVYEGCPESIQPFWISREPIEWPWCNLAANHRRPYCSSVNSQSPVGLVSRQWDAVGWACVHVTSHSEWQIEQISFITTMSLPILQLSCRFFFWQSNTSPTSVSPPTAQIWLPATSGFSQTWNRRWKGGDLWIRRSHSTQTQSTASHCRVTSPTGEWMFMDAQQGLLWMTAKLHQGHANGSRGIQNIWILSGQLSYYLIIVVVLLLP